MYVNPLQPAHTRTSAQLETPSHTILHYHHHSVSYIAYPAYENIYICWIFNCFVRFVRYVLCFILLLYFFCQPFHWVTTFIQSLCLFSNLYELVPFCCKFTVWLQITSFEIKKSFFLNQHTHIYTYRHQHTILHYFFVL